jgi:hypothetical protein
MFLMYGTAALRVTPRLSLRAAAKADLREAFEWYEARSTGLGFEFLRAARAALALIERRCWMTPGGSNCSGFPTPFTTSSIMTAWS